MATTKIYLDKRATKEGEPAPIKLCITRQGKSAYMSLDVKVAPEHWDAKKQKVIDLPNRSILNNYIENRKLEIDNLIFSLSSQGELKGLNAIQIKNKLQQILSPEENRRDRFINRFQSYAESRNAQRTREIYSDTLKKIKAYDPKAGELTFDMIRKEWIIGFQSYLVSKGLRKNTINIHMRNVRAVIRDAIDNEITTNYPIRKVDIRPEETKKRSLSIDELRKLFSIKVEKWQQRYQDYFKLSFFLIGINPADLLTCGKESLSDGRLTYKRAKTGKMYRIKVEPEAAEIIEKYSGKELLVNFAEGNKRYKTFVAKADKALKTIGEVVYQENKEWKVGSKKHRFIKKYIPCFPELSIYWCRHTWATIAFSLGIPDETIAAALGHSHGNKTTAIYIDKSIARIDEANRKVMDFVLKCQTAPQGTKP